MLSLLFGSAFGIATGYQLNEGKAGVRVPARKKNLTYTCSPDLLWDPTNLLCKATGALFMGAKRQEREAVHSPPTSAEVKKR
jgi:hypothetical protein